MSESEEHKNESAEEKSPVVYASPVKRAWAWVGVVYAIAILLLVTWYMATATYITGVGALMLVPALVGLGATIILRYRAGGAKGGLPACILLSTACLVLIVLNLLVGIPALVSNFGG